MSEDLQATPLGEKRRKRHWLFRLYELATLPFTVHFILSSPRIDPSYNLTAWRRFRLGMRM